MSIRTIAKMLIKKPLNALGFDITRRTPPSLNEQRFEPSEDNRFIWLSSLNINTVLDIGAHTGEFAAMIHKILPNASILCFEPLEDCFRQLEINMRDVSNIQVFNFALGWEDTEMDIYRNEFAASSSLLKMTNLHKEAFPFTARETVERIKVRRLDNVIQEIDLEDNILVKIDVQGYEDKVILGGENLISSAKLLIVETSFQTLYEGQPLFDDIYDLLRQRGFRYIGSWGQLLSPMDGSILQSDSIFIK